MKINNINKLTILSCLLITSSIKAQNFYTCMPKKDWFKKMQNLVELEEKLEKARQEISNVSVWELIHENKMNGTLDMGIYKVVLKGGDGGNSGRSQNGGDGGHAGYRVTEYNYSYPNGYPKLGLSPTKYVTVNGREKNLGSEGEKKQEIFIVENNATSYEASFGRKGEDGGDGKGGKGGDGGGKKLLYSSNTNQVKSMNSFFPNKDKELPTLEEATFCNGGGGGGGGGGRGGQGGGGVGAGFKIYGKVMFEVSGGNGAFAPDVTSGKGGCGRKSKVNEELGFTAREKKDGVCGDDGFLDNTFVKYSYPDGEPGNNWLFHDFKPSMHVKYENGGSGFKKPGDGLEGEYMKGGKGGDGFLNTINSSHASLCGGEYGDKGVGGKGGRAGNLMKSGEKSRPGDGYIRIYKYKG